MRKTLRRTNTEEHADAINASEESVERQYKSLVVKRENKPSGRTRGKRRTEGNKKKKKPFLKDPKYLEKNINQK